MKERRLPSPRLKEKEVEAYASSVNSLREVELKKKRRDKIAESARTATSSKSRGGRRRRREEVTYEANRERNE